MKNARQIFQEENYIKLKNAFTNDQRFMKVIYKYGNSIHGQYKNDITS